MSGWLSVLRAPNPLDADAWFARIADKLLNAARLRVAGERLRFTEIECYYHGRGHADPFSHCDPVQQERGRWYFHRRGRSFRNGSFKGLDLAFGTPGAFGGVLIRGLETADGKLIDGPSVCVDYLLRLTGAATLAALDQGVGDRRAWEANPLILEEAIHLDRRPIVRCARVGLSLKKVGAERQDFLLRPYRFLSRPRQIGKGKLHMVLALHALGKTPAEIRDVTGCSLAAIARYVADFDQGRHEADFAPYLGVDLTPRDLCRLHGVWYSTFSREPRASARPARSPEARG